MKSYFITAGALWALFQGVDLKASRTDESFTPNLQRESFFEGEVPSLKPFMIKDGDESSVSLGFESGSKRIPTPQVRLSNRSEAEKALQAFLLWQRKK